MKTEKTQKEEIQEAIKSRFGAQIDEWKKLYGTVKGYEADGKIAVFRVADINIIDACRTIARGSTLLFDMVLLENCWLDGDKELMSSDKHKLGIANWADNLIEIVAGEMVEL